MPVPFQKRLSLSLIEDRPEEDAAVLRRRSAALADPFAGGAPLEDEGVAPCLDLMSLRIFLACKARTDSAQCPGKN